MTLSLSGSLLIPDDGVVNSKGNINAQGITNDGQFNAIRSTITVPSDGAGGVTTDGVVNNSRMSLINTTFNSDLHSSTGSTIDAVGRLTIGGDEGDQSTGFSRNIFGALLPLQMDRDP